MSNAVLLDRETGINLTSYRAVFTLETRMLATKDGQVSVVPNTQYNDSKNPRRNREAH